MKIEYPKVIYKFAVFFLDCSIVFKMRLSKRKCRRGKLISWKKPTKKAFSKEGFFKLLQVKCQFGETKHYFN